MTKINLNQSPYFDDSNESKKFHKILFRPGRAVQARELTQMQTALQTQIERFGRHIFEQGSQVLPGSKEGVKYINNNGFIKIPTTSNAADAAEIESYWLGKIIKSTSGLIDIKATVIGYRVADSINEVRLYVTYTQADTTGVGQAFVPGQNISTEEVVPISATITAGNYAVGQISSVIVEEGVYFFDGNFILVDQQTAFLVPTNTEDQGSWNNKPTALVGLRINESIITSEADETLLDNALGSPNYSAPGADRLHIASDLEQAALGNADSDFIVLLRVVDGDVQARVIRTEYSVLEDTLARRTNDESGDYTVIPFAIQIKEFLRNATNNGVHNEREFHFDTEAEAKAVSVSKFGLAGLGNGILHPDFDGKYVPGTSYNTTGDDTSFIQLCDNRLSIKIDSGKAYVKGYEIEKNSTSVVDVEKARTLKFRNNKTISTPLGTFVYVKNLCGPPGIEAYDIVDLQSKPSVSPGTPPVNAKIGTARVLAIEFFSGVVGSPDAIYRLFLFNVKADPGKDLGQLKSIYSGSPYTFTCDTATQRFGLAGSVTGGSNVLIGNGTSWKNDELQRLKAGDYVRVSNGFTEAQSLYLVTENPANDNTLAVSPDPTTSPAWPPGSTIDFVFTVPQSNSSTNGLLFNLPDTSIYTLRGGSQGTIDTSNAGIDTNYSSRRVAGQALIPAPGGIIALPTTPANEEYDDFSTSGYVVINRGSGDWLNLVSGNAGAVSAGTAAVEALGSQCSIYLHASDVGLSGGSGFYVIVPIIHEGNDASKERAKNLSKGFFTLGVYDPSAPVAVTTGSDVAEISLGKADILRITRIVEAPDYSTTPSNLEVLPSDHKDITGLYILDNGQRDYFYDIGRVILRPGSTRPRGRVRVEFDYFEHGSTGNYFSVDSYPTKGPSKLIDYGEIPDYTASDGTYYDLTNAVDFRPRVNIGGVDSGFATTLELPKENFRCDYHLYEGRIDKLFLDRSGKFLIKSGNPDIKPSTPEEPETGMVIYELNYSPYTTSTTGVFARARNNRRYTMRDIGKLETRIKNLEYYTSLSLLESNTRDLSIKDAQGNDKFKNGFLVDNFSTFAVCDLGSADFRAAIDRTSQVARPIIYEDNVGLFEKILLEPNTTQQAALRVSSKYQKTGAIYTLPYTPVTMLEQVKASKVSNINPYSVFTFVGAVEISPWSDEWRETRNLEPLNVVDSGAYGAARSTFGPSGTNIDYTQTVNNFTGSNTTTVDTGRQIVLQAGHSVRKEAGPENVSKRNKTTKIPPGYANEGSTVPNGRQNLIAPEQRTTTTLTGEAITTQFTSTFVDQGFSTPVSLGSRIVDVSAAEFMRSREVEFTAKAFMPFARLYPFFDDVDVSVDCKLKDDGTYGEPLLCDFKGRLTGIFNIPNKEGKRFKTGDRIFRLTTSPVDQKLPPPASTGSANYTARGWVDTKQATSYSTRLFTIDHGANATGVPISIKSSETLSAGNVCPTDPIAQSFFVYEKNGCFITSVDIFFYKKPTGASQPPVTLQIRPLESGGNPSNIILPFGRVIKEASEVITNHINLVTGKLTVTGYDNSDPLIAATTENSGPWGPITSGVPVDLGSDPAGQMVPTKFTFNSPIFLAPNESFCFVLLADSVEYNVWIAQSGPDITGREGLDSFGELGSPNNEVGTKLPILKDPYIQGVFFKSQNGISWTADQTIDMKFKIYKADFDTAVNGEIDYVNNELSLKALTLDPIETKTGQSLIRVLHPNHGHTSTSPASKVVFSPTYDILLSGTLSSAANIITGVGTSFNTQIGPGSFIIHPVTREQRKVIDPITATSFKIASPFNTQQLSGSKVAATSYLVPDGVASLSGIDASVLFNSAGHDVILTEMDYYIVDLNGGGVPGAIVGAEATLDGRVGGPNINATENKRFEELMLLTTPLTLPETSITWNIQTTSSCGVNDSSSQTFGVQPRKNLIPNEKIFFDRPMHVSSHINESGPPSQVNTGGIGDKKSLNIRAILKSSDRNISPVIDDSRFSVYLVTNRLDNPHGIAGVGVDSGSIINSVFDNYTCVPTTLGNTPVVATTAAQLWFSSSSGAISGAVAATSGSITVTGTSTFFLSQLRVGDTIKESNNSQERRVATITSNTSLTVDIPYGVTVIAGSTLHIDPPYLKIKTANAAIASHLSKLDVGKYLSISGASGTRNFTDALVLAVDYTPNNTVNDVDFVPDAPKLAEITVQYRSLDVAAMETNNVTFIQKDRFVDEIAPEGGSCSSKYVSKKLALPRSSNALKIMFDARRDPSCEIVVYYKLEPVNSEKRIDRINWTQAEFNLEINGIIQPATPDANSADNVFSSYESTLVALPGFIAAQVKIVMRGGNPARSTLIKNLRLIGLDE